MVEVGTEDDLAGHEGDQLQPVEKTPQRCPSETNDKLIDPTISIFQEHFDYL